MKASSAPPLLLILPIQKRNRLIFETVRKSYNSHNKTQKMIDEKEEKNLLRFVPNSKGKTEAETINIEEREELYNNICKENYFLIFFKVFFRLIFIKFFF